MKEIVFSHLLDIATRHEAGFYFECPNGDLGGNYLLMCFRTPALVQTATGRKTATPGDCIIHDPAFPLWHSSVPGTSGDFCNDWIYIAPEAIVPILEKLEIPCNLLLPSGIPDLLEDALLRIRTELALKDDYSRQIVNDTIFRMLLDIRRGYNNCKSIRSSMTNSELNHYPAFIQIRERFFAVPEEEYTIKQLALESNLSPGRFAVLYQKFFQTTPHSDILTQRLIKAKRLLKTTSYQIKEIAMLCGWRDEHYFSRIFHEKTGMSPGDFRQKC
ncbi:MAG: helix-turn-helix transcriptional regulator [Victivallales bacterium]|jgi:AraC-like DNA-binding protein|nr:helix-turn-helix transcriptional regulator [Victivallales bacterium]